MQKVPQHADENGMLIVSRLAYVRLLAFRVPCVVCSLPLHNCLHCLLLCVVQYDVRYVWYAVMCGMDLAFARFCVRSILLCIS